MKLILPLYLALAAALSGQPAYDRLLKGGHVVDPKNKISQVMDVAIAGGKIARVARDIPAAESKKLVNAASLYVTPGMIDIHVHVSIRIGKEGYSHSVRPE